MKFYSDKISLTQNSRGIYCLDTSIGCYSGMNTEVGGCYNDCYSAKSAKIYGYDFNTTVFRKFYSEQHLRKILNQINNVKLDFIRIGCSGDPSEGWNHTISIIKQIDKCNKQIVIITRHWTNLTDEQLNYFATINICVNSSISALDKPDIMNNCLLQYNRLKPVCKSILRIVSCDFNINNEKGYELFKIQNRLFQNSDIIDTVFRPSKKNKLILDGVINTSISKFMENNNTLVSKFNKSTYLGKCSTCHEMCGINIKPNNKIYPDKPGITKQLSLFKKLQP
jgi:hypothetical protein